MITAVLAAVITAVLAAVITAVFVAVITAVLAAFLAAAARRSLRLTERGASQQLPATREQAVEGSARARVRLGGGDEQ